MRFLPWSTIFLLMMTTGLKAELCLALTGDCMELEKRRIWVAQRLVEEDGHSRLIYFSGEEAGYSISIPEKLAEQLIREKRLQDRCKIQKAGSWKNGNRLWFTDSQGNALERRMIRGVYDSLRRGSGVRDVCMRTLRSNYLMASLREGGDFPSAIAHSGLVHVNSIMRYFLDVQREADLDRAKAFRQYNFHVGLLMRYCGIGRNQSEEVNKTPASD